VGCSTSTTGLGCSTATTGVGSTSTTADGTDVCSAASNKSWPVLELVVIGGNDDDQ
jgi:hypothetical protein